MTLYNVHLYREMRLKFEAVKATDPLGAAQFARLLSAKLATEVEDCDGEEFSALVDVAGDDGFEQSRTIQFEEELLRKAAPRLLAALELFLEFNDQWLVTINAQLDREHDRIMRIARAAVAEAAAHASGRRPS